MFGMNTSALYDLFQKCPTICTDSRKADNKSLFFALKGNQFDGNKFAESALKKCPYAIVDDPAIAIDNRYILVDDALITLQKLAAYHRKRLGLPILAITGTNGKTTTKELVSRVLSKKYHITYTQGNLNNHIGVPITLLSMNKSHEFGIVEMGANHIGEIELLCKISSPDYGIITNVGKAHLEGFGSFDGVKKAKGELYRYLYENDGLAFINYDNDILEDMKPPHSAIYYGTKGFTHCQGLLVNSRLTLTFKWISSQDFSGDEDKIDWNNESYLIHTQLIGNYNFENALAAVCIGNNFGVAPVDIKEAIESYVPQNNRSQIQKTEKNTLLLDNYNANPSSMKASLSNFQQMEQPNKVVILGDMFELGEAAIREHGAMIALIEQLGFEKVYCVGENFMKMKDINRFKYFQTTDELFEYLKINPISGSTILIKGSRGMKMEKIIPVL
jgi:UDP-N-acetylmuramoyl-tripeptide--D-alanyl-D-alanine ligase